MPTLPQRRGKLQVMERLGGASRATRRGVRARWHRTITCLMVRGERAWRQRRATARELVRRPRHTLHRTAHRARAYVFLAGLDARARKTGRHDELTPPRRLKLPGWRSSYSRLGGIWLEVLLQLGDLEPHHRVLDIGCGPGRLAAPLARYLTTGAYEGFDVDAGSILWARREITTRHPRVRFRRADVRNPQYNPRGSQDAASYRFPFADASFDLVVATSVFTHMPPDESEHYLSEAGRVLRPGGRLLATFFLLTQARETELEGREATLRLEASLSDRHGRPYRGRRAALPENRIALREGDVRAMLAAANLLVEEVSHGAWDSHAVGQSRTGSQDLIVARRA